MAGAKILLADDTRLNRELAKDLLEMEGYQIIEAISGSECIDKARQNKPDIILLDIELPDMSGLEVIKVIKKDAEINSIPVVAFTGYNRNEEGENFLAAGFAGFISKPFDIKKFTQMVAEFLKK
ncbi:MAG: response regulator [Thermodesulfobacteriota bacterium]|jgi:two-component system cell cycle response regulator DivK|nr:MAG: response regulator [Thermodesulfobacteriota bacterium]